jgi:hypothetical protein
MASAAKTSASAAAVAKVQAAARKAGHACNEHDQRFIGYALDEAIARRRNVRDVKVEYGALRIRFDLKDDGELEVVEEKGEGAERKSEGSPAGDGQASQRAPQRPPGLDPSNASRTKEPSADPTEELQRLRERAEKAAAKRRRHKASRRRRDEAKREQAYKYVTVPYGNEGAAITTVECPIWSTRMDLKTAFTRVVAEVTQRMAISARHKGALTRGASARFGGSDFQVSVLDGAFAAFVEAEELGEDLLVLIADGLTEERLVALLNRWSKAPWRKTAEGLRKMDQLD